MEHPIDDFPELNSDGARNVKQILDTFFYWARAVDPTMLVALNTNSAKQPKINLGKSEIVVQFLNYAATHPEAITRYHAIGMTLNMYSGASFLSSPGDKSRAGGYHYLSEPPENPNKPLHNLPPLNGTMHVEFTTMRNDLARSMESEPVTFFVNYQLGESLRVALE